MRKISNPVIPEELAKKLYHCVVCQKQISEVYGVWNEVGGGTCSRNCERIQEDKPKDFREPNGKT